jgi:heterodisulfide reductase subunit A-like polyferredoxin
LKAALVIGGGIAGIQASLDLANSGIKVHLVERSSTLGGRMAQLDKTFPTNDCAMCILSPKLVEVARHPNIELFMLSEVTNIEGDKGDFLATVLKHPRLVDENKCVGCGNCAEKCPVKVPNEFDTDLAVRKAIYVPFPQAVPLKYTIDKENCLYFKLRKKPIIDKKGRCMLCVRFCEAEAIDHEMKPEEHHLSVGAIIVSTGYELIDPTIRSEYGYGVYENVITSLQFERLLSASGPTQGEIVRPSDNLPPKNISFVQCFGSRDHHRGCKYCSRVCCMYTMKEAMLAKEHDPSIENLSIFFMDVRAYGKGFEDYFSRAKKDIDFYRGRPAKISEDRNNKDIIIRVENTETAKTERIRTNLLVLSPAIVPSKGTPELARILGVQLDDSGFFDGIGDGAVLTSREGIFVCGANEAPKDIPDTVAQASGAAVKAMEQLYKERVFPEKKTPIESELDISGEPRIGVFICHCGSNIAGVVDVEDVVKYAKTLPNVVYASNHVYTCSDDSQNRIQEIIKKENLNRVIVAACSPRTHEPIFRETCENAGLNPYLFDMANIRDQCSWVHSQEKEAATAKSKDLVRMAVARSRLLQPLESSELEVSKEVLIIGGGIAGISSALDLSNQGFKVHLVEKTPYLGGRVAERSILSPWEMEPAKFLEKKYQALSDSSNINIYVNSELKDIKGYIGNFEAILKTKPTGVNENCNACGECEKVCPIEVEFKFNQILNERKAIYIKENSYPQRYTIDFENCDRCGKCNQVCMYDAINLEEENKDIDVSAGTVILAIGSNLYEPEENEFGYDKTAPDEKLRVITNVELERLLGREELVIGNKKPKVVAFIHCVGSRDGEIGCSRYCCQITIKQALELRKRGIEVFSFYRDVRAFGKGVEELYQEARNKGVIFFRYEPENKPEVIKTDDELKIKFFDKLFGKNLLLDVDSVILTVGMRPREDTKVLQSLFKVPLSREGYFLEKHPKLAPLETNTDGIYVCGCAQYPKNIVDTVAQASGAAAKASVPMAKGTVVAESVVSIVDQDKCTGCGTCELLCPFGAISLDAEGKAEVTKALCKGCGTCRASCPELAITVPHFTNDQMIAQIHAMVEEQTEDVIIEVEDDSESVPEGVTGATEESIIEEISDEIMDEGIEEVVD